MEESARIVNRRFKTKLSKNSVHVWINEFKGLCAYSRIRDDLAKIYGNKTVFGKTFEHSGLNYEFQYHTPKLELLCNNGFSSMANYVKGFESGCLDYFSKIKTDALKHHQTFGSKTKEHKILPANLRLSP